MVITGWHFLRGIVELSHIFFCENLTIKLERNQLSIFENIFRELWTQNLWHGGTALINLALIEMFV